MDIAAIQSTKQTRSAQITRSTVNEKDRTVTLSFSSEEPFERFWGVEVLDHNPEAVDLARLNNGGALLLEHDPDRQIGRVERAWLAGKRGKAIVRFSRNPEADAVFRDVVDGIRGLVSVGYNILQAVSEGVRNGLETVRATRWQPLEISIVAIPADPTVGVGRSLTSKTEMKTVTPQAGPSAAEAAEMTAIATRTNNLDLLQRAFESGIGLEQFRQQIIDRLPSRKPIAPPAVLGESQRSENAPEAIGGLIGMAPGDIQRYSFARAINAAMTGKFDGLEGEAHQEYVRTAGVKPRGFCVPADVLARNFATRDHTAGTATAGGYLVTTVSSDFVTLLRNATKVQQLGARVLNGLVGNVVIPRMTAGTSATWVTENAENTESNATFGQLTLTPRRVSGYTEVSKQLIAQTTVSVDNLLQSDLAEAIGVAIDLAAIAGTGNAQPLGLLNTSGIGAVTFGAAPTWAKIVEFESDIEASNALSGSLGWLVSPTTKAKLKTTTKVSGDAGAGFLWQDGTEGNGIVNGYRAASTNQVANNIVFFGDWSQLVIGQWGGLELTVDNITKMRQGLVGINADMLVDVAVRRPEAFSVSTDSGAQA